MAGGAASTVAEKAAKIVANRRIARPEKSGRPASCGLNVADCPYNYPVSLSYCCRYAIVLKFVQRFCAGGDEG